MQSPRLILSAFTLTAAMLGLEVSTFGQEIRLQPISSTCPYTIEDHEGQHGVASLMSLGTAGGTVELEIHISGWRYASCSTDLGAYQATIQSSDYSSGGGESLIPVGWPDTPEDGAYIDTDRPDFVFFGSGSIPVDAVCLATLDYEYGSAVMGDWAVDEGGVYYGGTLILEVPPGAAGIYTIGFNPADTKTFLTGQCDKIPGVSRIPGIITVGDCQPNGILDDEDILYGTSEDCDDNGMPDECETDTDGDGVIDACDPCPQDNPDDTDDDGVCDSNDVCPGAPDVDSDGDGVLDCLDQCPGVDDRIFAPGCVDAIPTVSAWGLVILALLLLTTGKVCFGRRDQAHAETKAGGG